MFRTNIRIIDNYMRKKNLDVDLKTRVKKSMEYMWKLDKKIIEREQEIIDTLPLVLKKEVLLGANASLLKKIEILSKNFSASFLEQLALEVKQFCYAPDEIIYKVVFTKKTFELYFLKEGESEDHSLYIVIEGVVDLIFESKSKKQKGVILKTLSHGSSFGEIPFFSNLPHKETAKSNTFASLFRIRRSIFSKYYHLSRVIW